ncbi:MAG: DegT/DnrJ/EryC1/StrS family aminotransferase [Terriglobales bacterium]|jgi:dTDP-4-amino-4,6-dideoxygalactose transaminase
MGNTKNVPFLDLVTPHAELAAELTAVFREALRTAGFIGGPMVENFEREFAAFCDAKYCAGVGSGTDALRFALTAAGIGKGDAVITVPNTFIATTEAISQAGASTVFVDVDELTYNIDVAKLGAYLETCEVDPRKSIIRDRRTKAVVRAIVPVHLYGQMADMDAILELAGRYNLIVIEDACQAHGSEYFSQKDKCWKKAGSMGHAAAFSFYPGKNLGACGEAGAVTTNDEKLAATVKMIRDHGQSRKYYHDVEGYNGRLDSIQAGILSVKLKRLNEWNTKRRAHAATYHDLFGINTANLVLPHELPSTRPVYHLYVIRTPDREGLKTSLAEAGIGTAIHYPVPLHLQAAYVAMGYKQGDFPVTEKVASQILSLPMYPGLSHDEQVRVVASVIEELGIRRSTQSVGVGAQEQAV